MSRCSKIMFVRRVFPEQWLRKRLRFEVRGVQLALTASLPRDAKTPQKIQLFDSAHLQYYV